MARSKIPAAKPQRPIHNVEQKRRDIAALEKRISELDAFDPQTIQKRSNNPNVTAIETAIDETLARIFGHDTVEFRRYGRANQLDHGPVILDGGNDDYKARQYIADGKAEALVLLRQAIRGLEEEIEDEEALNPGQPQPRATSPKTYSRKVFIVHGHDDGAREAVARFLEKIGFDAIILHERANKGRTIITKFQEEAQDIGFAIVLMTPDDEGGKAGGETKPRARQNVVFELGFFIGALGASRVAALVKGNIERPSDFDGVVYINLEENGWKTELGRELYAAGFEIDWNLVMRN